MSKSVWCNFVSRESIDAISVIDFIYFMHKIGVQCAVSLGSWTQFPMVVFVVYA